MPDFSTTAFTPEFGINCPKPEGLQTGDLLFPRLPTGFVAASRAAQKTDIRDAVRNLVQSLDNLALPTTFYAARVRSEHPADQKKLRELFDDPSPLLDRQSNLSSLFTGLATGVPASLAIDMVAGAQRPVDAQRLENAEFNAPFQLAAGASDLSTKLLLLNILQSEFNELTKEWLDMTLKEFLGHALGKFLLKTLQASEQTSFFVGHVAMVVREKEGQVVEKGGDLLVIEDNTTDFSHYRTAVHPYHVASDPKPEIEAGQFHKNMQSAERGSVTMRGWVNRRSALGQHVWAVRPTVLSDKKRSSTNRLAVMQQLADQAKRLHGRPYGFFDHPRLGDDNRMYCAEFIHLVFQRAASALGSTALALDGLCTWKWMRDYLNRPDPYGDQELLTLINRVLTQQPSFLPDRRFFVITPAMLAEAPSVKPLFTPTPVGDLYAAPLPQP